MSDLMQDPVSSWERRIPPTHLWPRSVQIAAVLVPAVILGIAVLAVDPVLVAAAAVGIGGVVLALVHPFLGVLAYLGCEYLRPMERLPVLGGLHLPRLIAACALLGWLARRPRYVRAPENVVMFSLLAVMLAATPFAHWRSHALLATVDFGKLVILYFLIANLANTERKYRLLVWSMLLLCAFLSIEQLLLYRSAQGGTIVRVGSRSGGFLGEDGDFALALLVVLPFAFFWIGREPSRFLRTVALLVTGLLVASIVATGSRGAALGLLAELAAFWLLSPRKVLGLVVALAIGAAWWTLSPPQYQERIRSISTYSTDPASMQRMAAWKAAAAMFRDNPLVGVGPDNFYYAFVDRYGGTYQSDRTVHNVYLQAASEMGILGLGCLFALAGVIAVRARRLRKTLEDDGQRRGWQYGVALALPASLLGFMVHGAFQTPLYYPHIYMLAALGVGLAALQSRPALEERP